jgi:hypothetical protein
MKTKIRRLDEDEERSGSECEVEGEVEGDKKTKLLLLYVVAVSANVGLKGLLVEKTSLNKPWDKTRIPAPSLIFEQCLIWRFVSSSTCF